MQVLWELCHRVPKLGWAPQADKHVPDKERSRSQPELCDLPIVAVGMSINQIMQAQISFQVHSDVAEEQRVPGVPDLQERDNQV